MNKIKGLWLKFKKLSKGKKIQVISLAYLFILLIVLLVIGLFTLNHKETKEIQIEEETPVEEVKQLQIFDVNSKSRPVAVMINNIGVARKYHSGLQDAYLVYELMVEGGLTRLMALYKDASTARIGSIRSSRHYYLDYALENDAIYVHWGYSEYAQNDIATLGINNVNGLIYGNKYFWKDTSLGISTEHTAFSSMDLINKGINDLGYRKTTDEGILLNYEVDPIDLSLMEGAIPATSVAVKYSSSMTTNYAYDEVNQNYKRSVNGTAHSDYITKEQYTAKNIIVYSIPYTTISGDVKGRQNISNIGSGDGYYISNGYAVPIKWSKASRGAKTKYTYLNGEEIKVNDGNTYIQIQPTGQSLNIS